MVDLIKVIINLNVDYSEYKILLKLYKKYSSKYNKSYITIIENELKTELDKFLEQ